MGGVGLRQVVGPGRRGQIGGQRAAAPHGAGQSRGSPTHPDGVDPVDWTQPDSGHQAAVAGHHLDLSGLAREAEAHQGVAV